MATNEQRSLRNSLYNTYRSGSASDIESINRLAYVIDPTLVTQLLSDPKQKENKVLGVINSLINRDPEYFKLLLSRSGIKNMSIAAFTAAPPKPILTVPEEAQKESLKKISDYIKGQYHIDDRTEILNNIQIRITSLDSGISALRNSTSSAYATSITNIQTSSIIRIEDFQKLVSDSPLQELEQEWLDLSTQISQISRLINVAPLNSEDLVSNGPLAVFDSSVLDALTINEVGQSSSATLRLVTMDLTQDALNDQDVTQDIISTLLEFDKRLKAIQRRFKVIRNQKKKLEDLLREKSLQLGRRETYSPFSASNKYSKNEKTFTGCDIKVVFTAHGAYKEIGELSMISLSTHREKVPVRRLGHVNPGGHTRGSRSIAGTMVFAVFNKDAFFEVSNSYRREKREYESLMPLVDQLPPFDVVITMRNEHGASAVRRIYKVEIQDDGETYSVDDMMIERVLQYVASDCDPLLDGVYSNATPNFRDLDDQFNLIAIQNMKTPMGEIPIDYSDPLYFITNNLQASLLYDTANLRQNALIDKGYGNDSPYDYSTSGGSGFTKDYQATVNRLLEEYKNKNTVPPSENYIPPDFSEAGLSKFSTPTPTPDAASNITVKIELLKTAIIEADNEKKLWAQKMRETSDPDLFAQAKKEAADYNNAIFILRCKMIQLENERLRLAGQDFKKLDKNEILDRAREFLKAVVRNSNGDIVK